MIIRKRHPLHAHEVCEAVYKCMHIMHRERYSSILDDGAVVA